MFARRLKPMPAARAMTRACGRAREDVDPVRAAARRDGDRLGAVKSDDPRRHGSGRRPGRGRGPRERRVVDRGLDDRRVADAARGAEVGRCRPVRQGPRSRRSGRARPRRWGDAAEDESCVMLLHTRDRMHINRRAPAPARSSRPPPPRQAILSANRRSGSREVLRPGRTRKRRRSTIRNVFAFGPRSGLNVGSRSDGRRAPSIARWSVSATIRAISRPPADRRPAPASRRT